MKDQLEAIREEVRRELDGSLPRPWENAVRELGHEAMRLGIPQERAFVCAGMLKVTIRVERA